MKNNRQNVVVLALCQALMMSGSSLVIAVSALVGTDLAPGQMWATLPLGIQYFSAMATTIPASLIMRRIGRKQGFLLGLGIGMIGALVSAWAIIEGEFITYCLGAALIGMFNSFGYYYRFAAADIAEPEFRSKAISLVMAGGVVAAFTGPNLANWSSELVSGALFAGGY
ncbi:MAG: MFS transporter, partial [Arenicellales bacterium]|nr:MFS transporter [Arenicellales bacterium]